MKDSEIFSQAWCNLLFEGRNRAYGAYVLRRDIGRRYRVALTAIFAFFLFFVLAFMIMALVTAKQLADAIQELEHLTKVERLKPLDGHEFKDIAQGRPAAIRMKPEASMSRPDIVEGITLIREFGQDGPESLPAELDDLHLINRDTINDSRRNSLQQEGVHLTPVEVVECMPIFPGGVSALMKWLDAHIIYSAASVRKGVEGDMEVCFIVDKDGVVKDMKVTRSLDASLDQIALSALKNMPHWEPARTHNDFTAVQITLPIHFQLPPQSPGQPR